VKARIRRFVAPGLAWLGPRVINLAGRLNEWALELHKIGGRLNGYGAEWRGWR